MVSILQPWKDCKNILEQFVLDARGKYIPHIASIYIESDVSYTKHTQQIILVGLSIS